MKKSHLAILLNLIYWAPKLLLSGAQFFFLINQNTSDAKAILLLNTFQLITCILIFCSFYFGVFPILFFKKRKVFFIIYGLAAIFIIASIGAVISKKFIPAYMHMSWFTVLSGSLLSGLFVAFIACLIRAFLNWYSDIFYKKQLEKKNLEMEHALLKAQINPHFLFNTLNNIDVLIEQDPKKASVYLNKLSDILRFMLYESPAEKIMLTQEVDYIKQYIELQKIRTSNADFVRFSVEGNMADLHIAPMLFIPFIENAFKHCTDKKLNHAIEIDMLIKDQQIYFTCSNAFDVSAQLTQPKSGLGLDLIKSRLNLLYKGNYQLKTDTTGERFTVNLGVTLHDN